MFKLLFLLCLMILATLLTLGGRENGPVRDGLAGKFAPLVYVRRDGDLSPPVVPVSAPAVPAPPDPRPANSAPSGAAPVTAASKPPLAAEPARSPAISAAFAAAETGAAAEPGLTLALPSAEGEGEGTVASPAPLAGTDPAQEPPVAQVIQYVVGNTVNVRAGPSAGSPSLTKLNRGKAVLVLPSDTPGWSMIRIESDGLEGYIASRFLGDQPGDGSFAPVN